MQKYLALYYIVCFLFSTSVGASGAGPSKNFFEGDPANESPANLRSSCLEGLTYNILDSSKPKVKAEKIAQALLNNTDLNLDFVYLQELQGDNTPTSPEKLIAQSLGLRYTRFISKGGKTSGQGSALLSRYPFLFADYKVFGHRGFIDSNRVMLAGAIEHPRLGVVWFINVHLAPFPHMVRARRGQIREVLEWIEEKKQSPGVKKPNLIVFGGDFNAEPDWSEIELVLESGFQGHNAPNIMTWKDKIRVDYFFLQSSDSLVLSKHFEKKMFWHADNPKANLSDHAGIWHRYCFEI